MKAIVLIAILTTLSTALVHADSTSSQQSQLGVVSMLTSQLGVTENQALGGAGAIFSSAKNNMTADNFGLLKGAVPGLDQILAAAPALGGNSNLLGAATSMLGGGNKGGGITSMLGPVFEGLGMDSGMVEQFIPIILQYVQTQGGEQLMGMLQSALN